MLNFKRKRQNKTQEQEIVQDVTVTNTTRPAPKRLDGNLAMA